MYKNLRNILNNKHKLMVYYSLIQSIIPYGITFFGTAYKTHQ